MDPISLSSSLGSMTNKLLTRCKHIWRECLEHVLRLKGKGAEDTGGDLNTVANCFDAIEHAFGGLLEIFVIGAAPDSISLETLRQRIGDLNLGRPFMVICRPHMWPNGLPLLPRNSSKESDVVLAISHGKERSPFACLNFVFEA